MHSFLFLIGFTCEILSVGSQQENRAERIIGSIEANKDLTLLVLRAEKNEERPQPLTPVDAQQSLAFSQLLFSSPYSVPLSPLIPLSLIAV